MAAASAKKVASPGFLAQLREGYKKFMFLTSDYHKYGMLHDDCLLEDEVVQEALRRLPQQEKDVRTYRIIRAVQCSIRHEYLPKDQWTTYEDNNHYLQPYIDEIKQELKEKHEWEKQ